MSSIHTIRGTVFDVKLDYTGNGKEYVTFRLSESEGKDENGKYRDSSNFTVTGWKGAGAIADALTNKDHQQVIVRGPLKIRYWKNEDTDKSGTVAELNIYDIGLLINTFEDGGSTQKPKATDNTRPFTDEEPF